MVWTACTRAGRFSHNDQNPNAMYDKGKFRLPLWYDGPANLMSDIVKRCMC